MAFSLATTAHRKSFQANRWLQLFIVVFSVVWANSLIGTSDLNNWLLENLLVFIFLSFFIISYKYYRFSDFSYLIICLYLCMHVYGSKYTYAENPFGFWLKDYFDLARNHYDRIVHFSFGFFLFYPLREAFLNWVKTPSWVAWLMPMEISLSISGLYELIEWLVADIFFKEQGDSYLGLQGDIWDAQKDMFLAFLGAVVGTILFLYLEKLLEKKKKKPIQGSL